MDAEWLGLASGAFDSVVAYFVCCSVPDPVAGLKEARRVCRPGGMVILLEHTRSSSPILGRLMDWLNPLAVHLMGENINRNTVANVEKSGLKIERVTHLWGSIFRLIEARR